MARYTVDILDNNGQRIGFIPAPVSPSYRRRHNQATSFSFGVLLDDDVAPLLTYGTRCILRREGVERVAGPVIRRDVSGQVMRVECITNEALLRDVVTPADWNYWAGWELGDAVRDLLMDFAVQAHNTPDDWEAAVEKVDVDLATWPGKVVLAKDATGHYKSHGYITLQFDFGQISRYQMLRWSEDVGEQVRIKAQFRTSADGTFWGAWSQELQSVFPSEDGVALTGSERYIQVRMHLYTDNTSEKDANGVPTGYTPVLGGVEVIARKPGPVTEGVIEATPDVILPAYRSETEDGEEAYSFNRDNALRILQTWCEDFGYEFRVDGQSCLYFGQDLGAKRDVVLRRTTNMDVKSLGDSGDKLANVLRCYGAGDGPAQIRTILRDQDSIDVYGERPGRFEDSSADTLAQLIESGNKHLAKVAQPEPQFVAHHVPVHELGEDIQLYDTVTVVDPKSGLVASVRILDEERQLTTSGEEVSLGLNCDLDNVIERIVKGQAKRPRPGGLPPEAPTDVRATGGYGYIQIAWTGNASQFVVEHSVDGSSFDRLEQTPYRNYLHMGLEPGSVHYYRVTAISSGGVSTPSSVVSAVVSRVPPEDLDQTPPATPLGLAAVAGAATETPGITTAWVDLSWIANTEIDLKDYYLRRRASGAMAWEHVATVPKASTSHTDRVGVVPGTTYEYAIAASDVAGNVSPWSEAIEVSVPTGITIPGAPSGLTGSFEGVDAVATWDRPRIPDFAQTVVEVQVGGVTKRTSHETSTTFAYTQAMNVADNGTAKPSVTIKIAHENHKGDRSQWASVTLTNGVPTAPAGFAMSSADGMVALSIDAPELPDFGYVEFQLALQSTYSDAKTVYRGRAFDALAPILAAARNYGRARLVDAFGQAGPWATSSVMGQPIPTYEPDTDPPAVPTGLTATGSAEMQADGGLLMQVELAWEAVADADLRAFAVRRRKGAGTWEQLATILATPGVAGAYIDAAGLATGVQYEYQVAAGDASGNWSAWSTSATVSVASDTTPPPAPTGLTGVFRDNDAIFAWDPCSAPDYKQSRIQIITGGTTKRTGRVDGTTFVYSLAMNRADHTTPQPKVTCRVAHEDRYGNVSGWVTVTETKPVPAAPTGFSMFSALTMIQMGCNAPDGTEVDNAEFQLATTASYSDAIPVYRGSTYQGIMAPIRATGTNYGRVRFWDIFGQAGSWATGSCTAKLIGKDDMQGAIFQITPSSTPAPSSGALEQLWDADTGTGPMFGSAPTIEFEYPIAELTDLVRFFVDRSCTYYVQAYNEQAGAWVDVVGSATAKVAAAGGQWHVRQFDGGKMVAARQLRIIFDRALRLTELKFWRAVIADEILVGTVQASQIATESIHVGDLSGGPEVVEGATGPIDADERPISSVNNQITMDSTGLKMRRAGETIDRMHLDARRLGFRDPSTGAPTAGIGYVRDLAQELDPEADPETLIGHGLFIAQGEIRASQSVLSESLTEGGTGMTKLADGSVTLPKLADTLSVTMPDRFQLVHEVMGNALANPGFETGDFTGWSGSGGTISTSRPYEGRYAAYGAVRRYQDIPAAPGNYCYGEVYASLQAGDPSYIELRFLNASKSVLATHKSADVPVTGNYEHISVGAVAPSGTAYVRLYLHGDAWTRFDACALSRYGLDSTYRTCLDYTIQRTESCEQIHVICCLKSYLATAIDVRVLVNGTVVAEAQDAATLLNMAITVDLRSYGGNQRIQVQAKGGNQAVWVYCQLMQNQRLPLRAAKPMYAVTDASTSSCSGVCEKSCQTTCQRACESSCQSTCQDACQSACQSTCEQTSQGGGCWVHGTPVTVIDGDHIYDIPVEELEPGMIMPWYDPVTDTLQESECLSNQRTYTHTIYVAEVEGGYTLEMTGEQPMDVLRPHYATGEIVWHKLPARYIRPGDKLVRPFDGTLHEVLSLERTQRAKTWVYNPRTASGRYIVHGFADSEKLLT